MVNRGEEGCVGWMKLEMRIVWSEEQVEMLKLMKSVKMSEMKRVFFDEVKKVG